MGELGNRNFFNVFFGNKNINLFMLPVQQYPASRDFFLVISLLSCTKSFMSLVFHIVSLLTSPFCFSWGSKQVDYAKY